MPSRLHHLESDTRVITQSAASSPSGLFDAPSDHPTLTTRTQTGWRIALNTALGICATAILMACKTPPPPPPPAPPPPAPVVVPVVIPPYSGPSLPIEQSPRGVQIFLPSSALFAVGKADLNPTQSGAYIDRIAELLTKKTTKNIELEGHTDNVGAAAANQSLSEARAKSVREALIKQGIKGERLQIVGMSFNRPIASNATEDGRKLNRRVEVLILDEKVENITQGEAPNAFESAWDKLKSMINQGLVKPVTGG
jgi:outer membrane protein OmpA-like peptidoglycan-associated protein